MAYRKDNLRTVKQAYTEKRARALGIARARLAELHRTIPELCEIDSALAETGMKLVNAITAGAEGITERVAAIRAENEELQEARAATLRFYGYSADYTDVHYECEDCKDTGYVGTAMCACMKRALSLLSLESAGLAPLARTQRFDTFSLDYYQGDDRLTMQANLEIAKRYAASFTPASESLLFLGKTGLGKTHLSTSIAVEVIDKGYDVVYASAPTLFLSLEAQKFGRDSDIHIEEAEDADLLILDDLGTENPSPLHVNFLYRLVNTRMVSGKATIINTNLTVRELRERYTDRVASRLLGEYLVLGFVGKDVRMQKIGT
ncbi:MAG: ATP-binding protein [Clostridia bacterium]|nr:ATP-binding protein [Clostridia bacterium]